MSKRHEIKSRIATFGEIKGILNAMKNLALLETHKLDTFLDTQQRVVASIEAASQDFLGFYAYLQTMPSAVRQLWIVIGSERGFCGDFNKNVYQFVQADEQQNRLLLIVGSRLHIKFQDNPQVIARLTGHSVAEEVQTTLLHLIEVLNRVQRQLKTIDGIRVVYYDHAADAVKSRQLLPLAAPRKQPDFAYPPVLNLEPDQFWTQLTDQYLYAALHEAFYSALMSESQMRLEHMEKAIMRLEKSEAQLCLVYNRVRQEEIIEEIEIILLSAEALSETPNAD